MSKLHPKVKVVAVTGSTITAILFVLSLVGVHNITPDQISSVGTATIAVVTGITTIVHVVAGYLKSSA